MKSRRILLIGFALVAVMLVALMALTTPGKYSRRSQRLPDGSWLKIVAISYGTNHAFTLPKSKPWRRLLVAQLPRSLTARLGWWETGGSIELSPSPGESSLAVFTACELARRRSFSSSPQMVLCDDQGVRYDSAFAGAVAGGFDGKHDWKLVGWQVSKIPHDSKRLRVEFSELAADRTNRQQVAEFFIPNPLVRAAKQ